MIETPDAAMMQPIEQIARFIAAGGDNYSRIFAADGVVILENFAPHLFCGPDGVSAWAKAMRDHAKGLEALVHSFGPAQDFSRDGERAFFCLPTQWRGIAHGKAFVEDGGWAFLLVRQAGEWRVQSYGWAVTGVRYP